ncbi:hypothetical protein FSP39_008915 [Pinctada imbricata]|uniref:RING-type domain-containing protein n=1 Tax=Pinctada imbricata TaxID=66713 RepID=A0AA88XZS5_PINIB|nr:hypothetical protein FSP39_008915 [Pinctada imbricata]
MSLKAIKREHLLSAVCVILRVPSLFIMDAWCRMDPHEATKDSAGNSESSLLVTIVYYFVFVFALSIALLPLRKLVDLYMYLISGLLLYLAYHISSVYVTVEKIRLVEDWMDKEGKNLGDEMKQRMFIRLFTFLGVQCVIAAFIAYLTEVRNWKKFGFLIFTLPLMGQICGVPIDLIETVHNFAANFTLLMLVLFAFVNFSTALDALKDLLNQGYILSQALGYLTLILTIWHTMKLPIQLLVFWLCLFSVQLYVNIYGDALPLSVSQEGWIFVVLAAIGDCCGTTVSLIALCVTISYVSYCSLLLTRLFLQGFRGYQPDNDGMRGWTEGFTMLLIAFQTGLLDLKPLQRAFLMSILLFIVVSSLLQSMYEMCDPILLSLSAQHNKSIGKNLRAIVLFSFLWMFPLYMTYSICQYFDLDFWLLVIMSSCLLTSVQVMGSLIVYTLFMYDSLRREPWDALDDVIYYVRSIVRVLEFVVAVFVVCYGLKESFFGEWSWINSSILLIHCYFNVWQRLQTGWKTFLLRREAIKRLESLPLATDEQLEEYNDVCPICYQSMTAARITHCKHFFHATCLKKWLYVKDSCPMCHKKIDQPEEGEATHDETEGNVNEQNNDEEDDGDSDNSSNSESESNEEEDNELSDNSEENFDQQRGH